jgi:hypothetical protein
VVTDRDAGEVDDDIGALRGSHQQPVAEPGDVHGRRQESALVPDLPHLDSRDTAEVEDEKP